VKPKLPLGFRFDGRNPAAQKRAQRAAADMITGISNETRKGIKSVIVRSIREGVAPYDAAREIRSLIGLTEQAAQGAMNYRDQLSESGLSAKGVDRAMEKYVDGAVAARADTIARTEIMGALNEGALEAFDQAQEEGLLTGSATKTWIATPDELTCPICEPLDGETVPLDEEFSSGDDSPPAHPNCRCSIAANAE
jgi:SPP1 gp7 family putative phage head morphogenesis protein